MKVEGKPCKVCGTTLKYQRSDGHIRCVQCTAVKSKERYEKGGGYKGYPKSYRNANKEKYSELSKQRYQNDTTKYVYHMIKRAEHRAKKNGLDFNLTVDDIVIPDLCPILGVPLIIGEGKGPKPFSPSLDKIDPEKGYVKGNVIIISMRANQIKSNASINEIEKVYNYLKESKSLNKVSVNP